MSPPANLVTAEFKHGAVFVSPQSAYDAVRCIHEVRARTQSGRRPYLCSSVQEVEGALHVLEGARADAGSTLNELRASTSVLPVEVLQDIFRDLVVCDPPSIGPRDQQRRPGWLVIRWTCARWRTIADCDQWIWALGFGHLPSQNAYFHERSGELPLTYEISRRVPRAQLPSFINTAIDYRCLSVWHEKTPLAHCSSITLTNRGNVLSHLERVAREGQNQRLQRLEHLTAAVADASTSAVLQHAHAVGQGRGLRLHAPNLRTITLHNLVVPVNAVGLERVSVTYSVSSALDPRPTWSTVYRSLMLPHFGTLVHLTLYNAVSCEWHSQLPVHAGLAKPTELTLIFPRLRFLRVHGCVDALTAILGAVACPALDELHVDAICHAWPIGPGPVAIELDALHQFADALPRLDERLTGVFLQYRDDDELAIENGWPPNKFSVRGYMFPDPTEPNRNWREEFLPPPPFSLTLYSDNEVNFPWWTQLYAMKLRTEGVEAAALDLPVYYWLPDLGQPAAIYAMRVIDAFPNLRSIGPKTKLLEGIEITDKSSLRTRLHIERLLSVPCAYER